jgi:hypothetical protein
MTVEQIGQLAYREGVELRWLATEPVNLEEIFLALTEPSARRTPSGLQEVR